jgi:cobalt-zinc-cadmium efflux system membrane fusion protein
MKRNRNTYFSLIILILFSGCGQKTTEDPTTGSKEFENYISLTQAQFDQGKMALGTMEERVFPKVVRANGMIDVPPENKAVISAIKGGYVKTAPLLIGDTVTKGQALLTLENPEFIELQQQYMEIHEQLVYLKAEYERQTVLHAENISSQKKLLKAESDYKTALSKNLSLGKQLKMLHIDPVKVLEGNISSTLTLFAPISGSITQVNITKGAFVSPTVELLEIINNDHIHLELSVFEKDIMKVKKGQKIEFIIPEVTANKYKAEVHLVGTSITSDRTIKVHGHLDKEETPFLSGMFVEADIITDSYSEKALPSESIITVEGVPYILVLERKEGNTFYFTQKAVKVKANYDNYSIIENVQEFEPATQFLTKGAYYLLGE